MVGLGRIEHLVVGRVGVALGGHGLGPRGEHGVRALRLVRVRVRVRVRGKGRGRGRAKVRVRVVRSRGCREGGRLVGVRVRVRVRVRARGRVRVRVRVSPPG